MHLVVRTRPEVVAGWSDEEVARRWVARFLSGAQGPGGGGGTEDLRLAVLLADAEKVKDLPGAFGKPELVHARAERADRPSGESGGLVRG